MTVLPPLIVLDYLAERKAFLKWAKSNFDPTDLSDPVNRLYSSSKTSVSPLVDVRWTRYINRYMAEKGYDSVLIRNRDALGADYWMVPDPARIRLLQEIRFPQPTNRTALANGILGRLRPDRPPASGPGTVHAARCRHSTPPAEPGSRLNRRPAVEIHACARERPRPTCPVCDRKWQPARCRRSQALGPCRAIRVSRAGPLPGGRPRSGER